VKFYKPNVGYLPRQGMQKVRNKVAKFASTSIRGNYQEAESEDEDKNISPGPGSYLT